jgi:hypothetical protein
MSSFFILFLRILFFLILLLITFNDFAAFLFLFILLDTSKDLHIDLSFRADLIGFEDLVRSCFCFVQIQKNSFLNLWLKNKI